MRLPRRACALVLPCLLLAACGQSDNAADASQQSTATESPASAPGPAETGLDAKGINCPPQTYADVSTLTEEQLLPLFEIARFSLDGDLTREEFAANPRYAEIGLFGAEFLATTDVAMEGIVDVTDTPPISEANAARLTGKLASLKVDGQYPRAGAMGTLQAKAKPCLLMIKNGLA